MGQGIGRVPEASAVSSDPKSGREPVGRYIAQQRRLRGIELEDLAARTRIPRRSLERLEAGAFDHSPDGFSRGFVRTVAEAIGVDPDDAVSRMLPEPDVARSRAPRSDRAVHLVAAAVGLIALALGARQLATSLPERPRGAPNGTLPVRRDFVRALAEAHGIETGKLAARDALLPPLPPSVPSPEGDPEVDALASPPPSPPPAEAKPAGAPAPSPTPAPAGSVAAEVTPAQRPAGSEPAGSGGAPAPRASSSAPPASTGAEALDGAAEPQGTAAEAEPEDTSTGEAASAEPAADGAPIHPLSAPAEMAPFADAEAHD